MEIGSGVRHVVLSSECDFGGATQLRGDCQPGEMVVPLREQLLLDGAGDSEKRAQSRQDERQKRRWKTRSQRH